MALYGALAKSKLLSEFDTTAKKASALANLGLTATAAELNVLDAVTAGTSSASLGLVLDANSELNSIGVLRSVDKIVTTAQVKALNATPITVLPAASVGAGNYALYCGAYVLLDYASAAYADDAGEDLAFQYETGTVQCSVAADGSLFDGTADALVWVPPLSTAPHSVEMIVNDAIEVTILVGEWITGDSPLKIRLFYRLVRLADLVAIA
jgi:hypothetical protein